MSVNDIPATGASLPCDSLGCPHTGIWFTNSGMLYCEGHRYLSDHEDRIKAASDAINAEHAANLRRLAD